MYKKYTVKLKFNIIQNFISKIDAKQQKNLPKLRDHD